MLWTGLSHEQNILTFAMYVSFRSNEFKAVEKAVAHSQQKWRLKRVGWNYYMDTK